VGIWQTSARDGELFGGVASVQHSGWDDLVMGQLGVRGGRHLGVSDQIAARHDRLKHPIVDLPGLKDLARPG